MALPLVVTLALMTGLLPLARLLHGEAGIGAVLLAGATVAAIVLLTAATQACLPELAAQPLNQLALVGSLRLILSLAAVLAGCLATRKYAHPEVLLYAVPFYLGLLAAESAVLVRHIRSPSRG